ncbi:MAG: diguanylate cyclase [Planctomycetes bacterium]|nr:diguanylate cyclase [Planctomycetota bacterium]
MTLRARLIALFVAALVPFWLHGLLRPGAGSMDFLGLAVASAASLSAVWFGGERLVTRRARLLLSAVEKLSQGDWAARAPITTGDELGVIGAALNRMAERLVAIVSASEEASQKMGRLLERRTREARLLNDMGELLQSCATPQEAYQVIGMLARKFFPAETGALFIQNASGNLVQEVGRWGSTPVTPLEGTEFAPEDCWALRRAQIHVVDNTASGLQCNHLRKPPPPAYVCIPLMAQGKVLGVLHLCSPTAGQTSAPALEDSSRRLAAAVAEHGAITLANLNLRETLQNQSIRDALTGLYNRRYMEESLEREVRRAARGKKPLGVIMFDVDHFKRFNDTCGHAAADAVLRELGGLLRRVFRAEDIACRYGGDEYVVILPDAPLEHTRRRALELGAEARRIQVSHEGRTIGPITLSIGVAVYPEHGDAGGALLRSADGALYQAKREGRDRVCAAQAAAASEAEAAVVPAAESNQKA